jgi:hypothetical protein
MKLVDHRWAPTSPSLRTPCRETDSGPAIRSLTNNTDELLW